MSDPITWTNETRKLSELVPWERNPRAIDEKEAERLGDSLQAFGQIQTLAIDPNNELLDGHQRKYVWSLLPRFGPNHVVDVRVSSRSLTEKERQKLVVYLHRGTNADWNWDELANSFEVPELLEWGFEESELQLDWGKDETPDDPGPQIDKAEELRQKWGVELGQLWQLNEHRLICGDCTDADVVARVMGGEKAAIAFTSPPYNIGLSAQLSGNTNVDDNLYGDKYDDNRSQCEYLSLISTATVTALSVSNYVFVNIQFLAGNKRAFVDYLSAFRDNIADIAIWDKGRAAPQQAQRVMDSRFEFVLVFSHSGTRAIGTRKFRGMVHNVYSGSPQVNNKFAEIHAATFPVEFPEHFIKTFTNNGEVLFEPFCGTGTTLIACERLNRKCRAVEISPAYCAVTIQRWVDMTGGEPVLLQ